MAFDSQDQNTLFVGRIPQGLCSNVGETVSAESR